MLEAATVRRDGDNVVIGVDEGRLTFPIVEMTEDMFSWQLKSRQSIFTQLTQGERPTDFHAHLPVVATFNAALPFPVHTATKGTGLLPRDELLEEYVAAADKCLEDAQGRPWEQSQASRIAVAQRLYENPEHIDRRTLGLIEIFQGQTYKSAGRVLYR